MHLFEKTETLNYSWDVVTIANWIKYPNDITTHVLSVDILDRSVHPVTGVLRTERLLCCKQGAPAILRTLGFPIPEVAWFREVSELNPVTREYTAKTVNLTMRNLMIVKETCIYREISHISSKVSSLIDEGEKEVEALKEKGKGLWASLASRGLFGVLFGFAEESANPSPAVPAPFIPSASEPSFLDPQSKFASKAAFPTSTSPFTSSVSSPSSSYSSSLLSRLPTFQTSSGAEKSSAVPHTFPRSSLTEFVQTAEFHAQIGISSVRNLMEEAARNRFQANAGKGLKALESVILRVLKDAEAAVGDVDG